MAKYEIEVDSQDEFYDDSSNKINYPTEEPNSNSRQVQVQVQSVVKRKGRGFSAEEPQTQVLGGIKHFDTIREEVSGRALRCKDKGFYCLIFMFIPDISIYIIYPYIFTYLYSYYM